MHVEVLRGRGFLESDQTNSPRVAVVNEHFADRFWPHEDAIGKRFHLQDANGPLVQVVGIAKQGKYLWIAEPPVDFFYLPFLQNEQSAMTLVTESPAEDASDACASDAKARAQPRPKHACFRRPDDGRSIQQARYRDTEHHCARRWARWA